MSLHPIFARLHADMAAVGLLPEPEQRAGESLAKPSQNTATDVPRSHDADPLRVWHSTGGVEL